jgi:hypothetical protein
VENKEKTKRTLRVFLPSLLKSCPIPALLVSSDCCPASACLFRLLPSFSLSLPIIAQLVEGASDSCPACVFFFSLFFFFSFFFLSLSVCRLPLSEVLFSLFFYLSLY